MQGTVIIELRGDQSLTSWQLYINLSNYIGKGVAGSWREKSKTKIGNVCG